MTLLDKIDRSNIPSHVAIIMDGNGRWAQKQGQDRIFGHYTGVESVREALKASQQLGVKHLTLYAFSTENWNRPKEEVDGLMDLLVKTIGNEVDDLHKNDVIISTIGDIEGLPQSCQLELNDAIERTKDNNGVNLILALNYSSRWEILNGVRNIAEKVKQGLLDEADINEELFEAELTTKGIPDPELIIRTSGEHRLSNFLLWQAAYSEFYFTEVLWPDFKAEDYYKAIHDYQSRERRFGLVSAQILKDE